MMVNDNAGSRNSTKEGLTFDDVLLIPAASPRSIPRQISLGTQPDAAKFT